MADSNNELSKIVKMIKKGVPPVDALPVTIIELDAAGNIVYCNDKACEIFGYSRGDIIEKHIRNFLKDQYRETGGVVSILLNDDIDHTEENFIRKDGSTILAHVFAARIENARAPAGFQFVIIDMGMIMNVEDRLREIEDKHQALIDHAIYNALHDPLTKTFNKETFLTRLQVEVTMSLKRKNRKVMFAVMCMGIDKFKSINDMYGSLTGDRLLQLIARRLEEILRQDDIISRFDGDKFMILFSEISSKEDVPGVVGKIFSVFAVPFQVDGNSIKVTSSLGICLYPDDAVDENSLIKNAEEAMYYAKNQGRNTYQLFDREMHNEMIRRIHIEKQLEYAVRNNEFVPFYQPKVNKRGEMIGMESLIRWKSSQNENLLSPRDFIFLAERNGMIIDIGNNILYQSCRQNRIWQDAGMEPRPVAVNLSPFQFKQASLITDIKNILRETKLDPRWLDLEITESGIMENEKESIDRLNEIHGLGISISIDDFGTGYSSLSKLKDYPIDTLKIDKSFVDNIPHDVKSQTIAKTIIVMAHNLGFKVVSEGIEREDQFRFFNEHDCDQYQGNLFSKPLPPDDFEKWMTRKPEERVFFERDGNEE